MYQFFLDGMLLPIAPSKMETKINGKNETLNLINEGEVNQIKETGLTEISFDFLVPARATYPFAFYDLRYAEPQQFLDKIEELKKSKIPFQFTVSRNPYHNTDGIFFKEVEKSKPLYAPPAPHNKDGAEELKKIKEENEKKAKKDIILFFGTAMFVTLEEYTITEDAGEGFDLIISVSLKQYRKFGPKTLKITKKKVVKEPTRTTTKSTAKKYTIKKGDTLYAIAKKHLGKGSRYPEIYKLNKKVIEAAAKKHKRKSSSKGHWIYPGTKLTLPKK